MQLVLAGRQDRAVHLIPPPLRPSHPLDHLDWLLVHDCRQFASDSCEYAEWGQHAKMGDALRAIWMFGTFNT